MSQILLISGPTRLVADGLDPETDFQDPPWVLAATSRLPGNLRMKACNTLEDCGLEPGLSVRITCPELDWISLTKTSAGFTRHQSVLACLEIPQFHHQRRAEWPGSIGR